MFLAFRMPNTGIAYFVKGLSGRTDKIPDMSDLDEIENLQIGRTAAVCSCRRVMR